MTTPWSIEFNKNILVILNNLGLERIRNYYSDGLIIFNWDRLRLNVFLQFSLIEIGNEFS